MALVTRFLVAVTALFFFLFSEYGNMGDGENMCKIDVEKFCTDLH